MRLIKAADFKPLGELGLSAEEVALFDVPMLVEPAPSDTTVSALFSGHAHVADVDDVYPLVGSTVANAVQWAALKAALNVAGLPALSLAHAARDWVFEFGGTGAASAFGSFELPKGRRQMHADFPTVKIGSAWFSDLAACKEANKKTMAAVKAAETKAAKRIDAADIDPEAFERRKEIARRDARMDNGSVFTVPTWLFVAIEMSGLGCFMGRIAEIDPAYTKVQGEHWNFLSNNGAAFFSPLLLECGVNRVGVNTDTFVMECANAPNFVKQSRLELGTPSAAKMGYRLLTDDDYLVTKGVVAVRVLLIALERDVFECLASNFEAVKAGARGFVEGYEQ